LKTEKLGKHMQSHCPTAYGSLLTNCLRGVSSAPIMALVPGTKLGPYEIQYPLGAGGMGEVYRACDLCLERSVAIKVLPAHRSLSPAVRARFEQEGKAVSALQHPNICVVHDIGSQDGVDFMVLEYVAGKTLDKSIPPDGLPADIALKYASRLADALACANARASFIAI
jgi:eukaryotic-like serine/threonine-protein kinase